MKKLLLLSVCTLLALLCMLSASAEVLTGSCGDNVTYSLDTSTGVLTISGSGAMDDYPGGDAPWNAYADMIKTVEIKTGVTVLGEFAFLGFTGLENLTIADSVTRFNCGAFRGCTALTSFEIPKNVTYIDGETFTECSSIKTFSVASGNTSFSVDENGILFSFDKNTLVVFPKSCDVTSYTVPTGVKRIEYCAFIDCASVTEILLPEGLEYIGPAAFRYCNGLTSLVIPDSVSGIGASAFADCINLESINIPKALTRIGLNIYGGCSKLTELKVPNGVTNIGANAFCLCPMLEKVIIPKSVSFIDESAFEESANVTIYGYADSYAETFAAEQGIPFVAMEYIPEPVGNGKCGESLTWELMDNGALTISGSGPMYNYADDPTPWEEYGNMITSVVIGEGVTDISNYAFAWMGAIKTVTFSSTVSSIGESTFYGCTSLGEFVVDEDSTAFSNDESGVLFNKDKTYLMHYPIGNEQTSYTLPAVTADINKRAFVNASKLSELSVSTGSEAFSAVDGVLFSKDKKELFVYPRGKSGNTYAIPSGTVRISDFAFENCTMLENVDMPDTLEYIGALAFAGSGLVSVDMPDSVTEIDHQAFDYCIMLEEITLSKNLKYITSEMFVCCEKLTEVVVPNSAEYIDWFAFERCANLEKIIIPGSVTEIYGYAFDGCESLTIYGFKDSYAEDYAKENNIPFVAIDKAEIAGGTCGDGLTWKLYNTGELVISGSGAMQNFAGSSAVLWNEHCSEITEITLSDGVTAVGDYAFANCTNVKSVTIPNGVTSIGYGAFADCTRLANVKLGSGLLSIGDYAFRNCEKLLKITVPESVTSIGSNAFSGCGGIIIIAKEDSYAKDFAADNNIAFEALPEYISGDSDGDGNITIRDAARILQYKADWDVEINLEASDVDGDGNVTIRDAARILQYKAGWDVALGAK